MFDQVFSSLQKATESTMKIQQDMLQKWMEAFPSVAPGVQVPNDAFAEIRKKWEEASIEMLRRQKELMDQNYDAGLKCLEDVFGAAEAKSPQEYQEKVTELYRQSIESLRKLSESQISELKTAAEKWSSLVTTSTTTS